jgi:hypothetical protein
MLLTADSLWKYIQSCNKIYCLPLLVLYYFENSDKQTLSIIFHISPVAPSSPPGLTQHQYRLPQARWQLVVRDEEKEVSNNLDKHRDQMELSHRYFC